MNRKKNGNKIKLAVLWIICNFCWGAIAQAEDRRFLVDVYINDNKHPHIVDCILDGEESIWLREDDLRAFGLRLPQEGSREINNQRYFCLCSYEYAKGDFDFPTLSLYLTIPADYFFNTQIDLSSPNQERIRPLLPGGFLNYDISLQHTNVASQTNGALVSEVGYFNPYGVGTCDFFLRGGQDTPLQWIRLETTWTLDQPENITTWNIGDAITSNISWSAAVRFAGVQWSTNFNTQPYLVTFPLPAFSGQAIVPTTLSVFVNDALNFTEEIKNGPFSLYDIPVVTGAGTVRVVTNDLLGRQREMIIPYYSSQQLLKGGLVDFSYEIGIIRDNYGLASFDYSQWFGVGTYQKGLNDHWTAGWHAELLGSQQTIGVSSEYLWNNFLVISFGSALSHNQVGEGGLLLLGMQRQTPWYTIGFQAIPYTSHFTELGWMENQLAPHIQMQSYVTGTSERWGTISASYTWIQNRVPDPIINSSLLQNLPNAKLLTLNYSHNLVRNLYFILGSIIDFNQSSNTISFLSFVWGWKENYSLSATSSYQTGGGQQTILINKNVPWGNGYGYHLSYTQGEPNQGELFYTYQNDYGTYSATLAKIGDQTNYLGEITGSVVQFAGHTVLSRALYNSFALVEIPEFDNICVYNRNTCVGETHSNGILLVPNILPYQNNKVSIDLKEFPLNTEIPIFEREAMPYYRSGVLMSFPVRTVNNITLQLIQNNGESVPTGAFVSLEKDNERFPVVQKGFVFLSSELSGIVKGVARWDRQKECHFTMMIPIGLTVPVFDRGEILCH